MEHYLPQIYWHDRTGLLSTDFHPVVKDGRYKIATSSVQKEVRIWEYFFFKAKKPGTNIEFEELQVNFIANLVQHNNSVNIVRFSPAETDTLLASGDSEGRLVIWRLNDQSVAQMTDEELPPNKENWVRYRLISHEQDVTSIAWNPEGKLLASVGRDGHLMVHEVHSGKRTVCIRNFRQFPNGITWDPRGKYLAILSMDRKMDIVDCNKGTKLKSIAMADLPARSICGLFAEAKPYRLWHDDQLAGFQRGVAFSPCGELIVAPAVQMEIGTQDIYGTFVFKRSEIDKEKPFCLLPTAKATFLVRMCPLIFELRDSEENYTGLPHRVMWLVLSKEQMYIYDSQHRHPIGYIDNIHYNNLTDAAWSADGKTIIISSLEGYNSFLKLYLEQWGNVLVERPEPPPSPQLIKTRKKRAKVVAQDAEENAAGEEAKENVQITMTAPPTDAPTPTKLAKVKVNVSTPSSKLPTSTPTTPKAGPMDKFVKKETLSEKSDDSQKNAVNQPIQKNDASDVIAINPPPKPTVSMIATRKEPRKSVDVITIPH
ncbi:unnamed protein product, partial [Mesorhabditis belari]|uniref:Anaphase-promoting complex subunit 4-like WD40 domain-containing protein n=1 Tax=Mesorhabditis belari TaxID=2138241 RepID=A0AAF3FEG3_9BILA